eukprot:CAMPEP_0185810598 /NCGR_PEP_ID=MMETSP1322-20130828/6888_1 /TAXON_ID=265543 /ORGANISM="Minutocellus polymorphus, Strain RCC2270" /LENGTH=85 /DNA_ID=CAMNT_0028506915 /DNA_START=31 /DNA_END=288 /DNA_ORIENTATION=+
MKYLAALALLAGSAAAFAPTALVSRTSALSMAPPNGTPAASHEEDLDKTFKVIMDFNSDGDEAPAEAAPEAAPKKKKGKKQPQHE